MNVLTGTPLLPTYARFPVTFVDGEGSWLIADDARGRMSVLTGTPLLPTYAASRSPSSTATAAG